jgi:hypothetical protein
LLRSTARQLRDTQTIRYFINITLRFPADISIVPIILQCRSYWCRPYYCADLIRADHIIVPILLLLIILVLTLLLCRPYCRADHINADLIGADLVPALLLPTLWHGRNMTCLVVITRCLVLVESSLHQKVQCPLLRLVVSFSALLAASSPETAGR